MKNLLKEYYYENLYSNDMCEFNELTEDHKKMIEGMYGFQKFKLESVLNKMRRTIVGLLPKN